MDTLRTALNPRTTQRTSTLAQPSLSGRGASSNRESSVSPRDTVTLSGESTGNEGATLTGSQMQQWFVNNSSTSAASQPQGAPKGTPDPHFQYDAPKIQDLRGSVAWQPGSKVRSGTDANDQVTNDYQHLNQEMQKYMAGDPKGPKLPPVADFAGMAKYGSRLAGEQIRNLEDLEKGAAGDPKALTDAARNMANPDVAEQGVKMGAATVARNASDENPLIAGLAPGLTGAKVVGETAGDAIRTMGKMRDILVEGNTTIHDSAGRAYDAFLKGESSGQGGMEALKEAGYSPGSQEDPMGMYTQGFGQYKEARELGLQAQQEKDPAKREQMLKQREDLMKNANLKLFIHEQKSLEQPNMYGDKDMKNAVQSIGGSMTLQDANGRYDLLPNGGDWTDFNSRMGFKEVASGTPGAIEVPNPDGTKTNYQVDPSAKGTVSDYSNSRTSGAMAATNNASQPDPLHQAPTTATGKGVDRIGTALSNGNFAGAAGAAITLPERLASDGLNQGGQALRKSGANASSAAIGRYAANAEDKDGLGDDLARISAVTDFAGASLKSTLGSGMEAASDGLNAVSQGRDWVWNNTLGKLLD